MGGAQTQEDVDAEVTVVTGTVDPHNLPPDTRHFLRLLSQLRAEAAAVPASPATSVQPDEGGTSTASAASVADDNDGERTAARGVMAWSWPMAVARAPGRLDVMGGIADYSGSLVLQMPTREACHVAFQIAPAASGAPTSASPKTAADCRNEVIEQHQQQQQQQQQELPLVRVVSLHSSTSRGNSSGGNSHRGHTFTLPLAALFPACSWVAESSPSADGREQQQQQQQQQHQLPHQGKRRLQLGPPTTYESAQQLFRRNGSSASPSAWAAYVVGPLLVLATERETEFAACFGAAVDRVVAAAESSSSSGNGGSSGSGGGGGGGGNRLNINVLVRSEVPEGKGVASSAALEVASMSAMLGCLRMPLEGRDLALLCQRVENAVVGAPCGVMDQMASALGRQGQLLALLCQPAELQAYVRIPAGIALYGIDSGVRHALSAGGCDYGSVRAAAFMGRCIVQEAMWNAEEDILQPSVVGSASSSPSSFVSRSSTASWHLCSLRPHSFEAEHAGMLPESMRGEEFLVRFPSHGDAVTTVQPGSVYPVRAATRHPVWENFRVHAFAAALQALMGLEITTAGASAAAAASAAATAASRGGLPAVAAAAGSEVEEEAERQMQLLGEIMLQCHESYSACGLGSDATDAIVRLVRRRMRSSFTTSATPAAASSARPLSEVPPPPPPPLYGAKITGGGSGGTVCVMGRAGLEADAAVAAVCDEYEAETGRKPLVLVGSSMGAAEFGCLDVTLW